MKTHRNRFGAKKHAFGKKSSRSGIFKRLSLAGGERLEVRSLLTGIPLQNPVDPWDVNDDGHVTPQDALAIINQLSSGGSQAPAAAVPMISALALSTSTSAASASSSSAQSFSDVNGDGNVTPADVLSVINQLAAPDPNPIFEYRLEAEDLNGNPISTITVGQNFELAAFVHDLRNPPANNSGVFAGFVNVAYDPLATIPAGTKVVHGDTTHPHNQNDTTPNDPFIINGQSVAGFFTLVPSGDLSTPGKILGAGASGTSLIAPGDAEQRLWMVKMQATGAGVETFSTSFDSGSGHDSLLYDLTPVVTASQIKFDTTQLTIVAPTVNISPPNAPITEANSVTSPFVFTVSLSGSALTQNATVVFNTGGGTAVAGTDYHATSGTLTFTVGGPTTQTIAVTGIDDQLSESDETFSVSLSAPTNVVLGTSTTAAATILDSDDPLPTVSISSPAAKPDGSAASTMLFTVSLSTASGQQTTVNFATADVTAISAPGANQDYQATSGTLTFLAGQTSQVITVNILGDSNPEIDETFNVVLSNPSHLTLGMATGMGTILNDDLPTLSMANVSHDEGNSGTTPFVFTAALSQPSPSQVTVVFTTTDGTGQGTAADPDGQPDYVPTSGTLTFAPNSTSATITVLVNGNTINEINENFHVVLSNPTNAIFAAAGPLTASGTILNDDGPRVSISPPATIIAPQTGTTNAVFNVQLLVPSAIPVVVTYTTLDGPGASGAKAANDYVAQTSGTLTFNPSVTSQDITVVVNAEPNFEPNETFLVSLTGVVDNSATIEQGNATGTIQSSVAAPTVSFSASQLTAIQSTAASTLLFTVNLSAPVADPVQVTFQTADDTATTANADYTATSGTLTFAAGVTQQVITVQVLGDTANDQDEDFKVNLTSVSNLPPLANPVVATGVIHNTNSPPNLAIGNVSATVASSGTTNVVFTLTLSHATGEPIVVNYVTADGTATVANGDYAATSGTLTFNPGDPLTKLITVVANGDPLNEANEDFNVNLTTTTPTTVNITQAQGDGTLVSGVPQPTVTINNVSQNEPTSGSINYVFTASLSAASGQDITVAYTTVDGTATTADSDFVGQAGTLTFAAGTTTQLITVQVNGDTLNEPNETFHVNLTGATHATVSSSQGSGTGTLVNQNPLPTISIGNASHMEGDSGTQPFVFQVNLSTLSGQVVTVAYATADGTATVAAHDYVPTSGILTFNPGIGTLNVTVAVVGDLFKDPDEQFSVNLSNPQHVTLNQAQGIGLIQSNPNHTLDFTPSDISGRAFVANGSTPLPDVTVTLTGTPSVAPVPAGFATLPLTTQTAADGTFVFANLLPGTYQVSYAQPNHFLPATVTTFNTTIAIPGGVHETAPSFTVPGLDPKSFSIHDLWALLHPSSTTSSSTTQQPAVSATSLAAPAAATPAAVTAAPSVSTAASVATPLATSDSTADPFSQSGSTVTVNGTSGDDNFEFTAGALDTVTLNGVTRTFDPAAVSKIIFDGGTGKNTAKLTGSAGNDTASLGLGSGTLNGSNFSVSVSNVSSLTVNGGGGQDTATLQDSTSNDHLQAAGDEATLSNDLGYLTSLMAFSQVQAKSSNGGTDTAQVGAIDFALQQQGNWLSG